MKKLLLGSSLLMLVAAYASNKNDKSSFAFSESRWNTTDTVPKKDTTDTPHLANVVVLTELAKK